METIEAIDFPHGLEIFDDYDEYLYLICTAYIVPMHIWRGFASKEDFELAELRTWVEFKNKP